MQSLKRLITTTTPSLQGQAPILFTPGMLTNQQLWKGTWSHMQSPQQKLFADFSDCTSLSAQIKKITSLTHSSPFHLVGFSMGGYISIEYILQHPELVSSLILMSTSARGYSSNEREQREQLIAAAKTCFNGIISPLRLNNWLAPQNQKEMVETLCEMARQAGNINFIRQQTATLDRTDRRELLRSITIPTLIIHGKEDKLIRVSQSEELASIMPNATLEVVSNAGHMVPLEQPEKLAEIFTKWFNKLNLRQETKAMGTNRVDEEEKKMAEMNVYTLRRGKEGEERLGVLNGIYNEDSQTLLLTNGIKEAKKIVDIGCGTGQMACWIASQNPDAHVTCLDISPGQIEVAKANAQKANLTNMSFFVVSIYELETLKQKFDFAYTRFVLAHLDQPQKALNSIQSILAPNGKFVCEEAVTSEHYCSVADANFKRYYEIWSGIRKAKGADPEFGTRLKIYAEQAGMTINSTHIAQRDLSVESNLRSIYVHNLREVGQEAIRYGLTTQKELDELIPAMEKLIKRQDITMRFSASMQVSGIKPALEIELTDHAAPTRKSP